MVIRTQNKDLRLDAPYISLYSTDQRKGKEGWNRTTSIIHKLVGDGIIHDFPTQPLFTPKKQVQSEVWDTRHPSRDTKCNSQDLQGKTHAFDSILCFLSSFLVPVDFFISIFSFTASWEFILFMLLRILCIFFLDLNPYGRCPWNTNSHAVLCTLARPMCHC